MTWNGAVLVITEALDTTADTVITERNRRGTPVVRFNPADIGAGLTVSAWFDACPAPVTGAGTRSGCVVGTALYGSSHWAGRRSRGTRGHGERVWKVPGIQLGTGMGSMSPLPT